MTLRGHFTARRFPERAMIHLIIESTGESEETVSREVISTCNNLREILEALCLREENGTVKPEAAVSSISASHIYLASKDPNANNPTGDPRDRPLVHNATITFYAVFCDFNEMHKLNDISWYLTDATNHEVGAQARKRALLDAIMKANQYAAAIDLEELEAVELKEIEPQPLNPAAYPQRPTYRHSSGVDLMPQDIVFNCAVEIYFEAVRRGSMWCE
ncbi:unnamed protein product [Penicillium discolor]